MSFRIFGVLGIIVFAGCIGLHSQPLREPTYEMKLAKAEELVDYSDYFNALDMYEECYRESRDRELLHPIARMHYKLRDYERAERYYERVIDKAENLDSIVMTLFEYANCLLVNGKSQEAIEMYGLFISKTSSDSLKFIAENHLLGTNLIAELIQPFDIFATPLEKNVNSGLSDHSPALGFDEQLYFSSFRQSSAIVIEDEDAADFHMGIYTSKKDKNDEWDRASKMNTVINREDYHSSNVSFSEDGRSMYFTRNRLEGDRVVESRIFMSSWDGNKWEGARELENVNGDWIATHPFPGELFGNNVLYFVSDMPGNKGGLDIYYATHEGGIAYDLPVNLGDVINGPGNEITPFYQDGTLYYSSDGEIGIGGQDIFKSSWDGSVWSKPENMGLVFNSPYDDFYFKFIDDGKNGYLVSNRPYKGKRSPKNESCCDDIFAINTQEIILDLLASVYDEFDEPLEGVTIKLSELRRNSKTLRDAQSNKESHDFVFPLQVDKAYVVRIEKEGFFTDSFEVNTVGYIKSHSFEQQVYLKSKEPVTTIVTINEPIRLNNIYYDFDDDQILPEAEADLEFLLNLMQEYPKMVIELSAHTDSRSNDSYNIDLSQRRANSAKDWMVAKGVRSGRIKAVGYGETQILNNCTNGVPCTEEEHRLNRRSEFKIIEGPTTIEIQKEVIKKKQGGGSGSLHFILPENNPEIKLVNDTVKILYPNLKFEKSFHDFGLIDSGQKPVISFEFENIGEMDLVIEWVSSPKHTEVFWPHTSIKPGEKGVIIALYDSSGEEGENEVTIDVIANTKPTITQARFRAFVERN